MLNSLINNELQCNNELESVQHEIYRKLAEAVSEIENGAKGVDAEEFIQDLMNCEKERI